MRLLVGGARRRDRAGVPRSHGRTGPAARWPGALAADVQAPNGSTSRDFRPPRVQELGRPFPRVQEQSSQPRRLWSETSRLLVARNPGGRVVRPVAGPFASDNCRPPRGQDVQAPRGPGTFMLLVARIVAGSPPPLSRAPVSQDVPGVLAAPQDLPHAARVVRTFRPPRGSGNPGASSLARKTKQNKRAFPPSWSETSQALLVARIVCRPPTQPGPSRCAACHDIQALRWHDIQVASRVQNIPGPRAARTIQAPAVVRTCQLRAGSVHFRRRACP